MNLQEFKNLIRLAKVKDLQNIPDAEIAGQVRDFLEEFDSRPDDIDFDRLMSSGILLARANKEPLDETALEWFFERPTTKRLDIVSAFLNGLWKRGYRRKPVDADRITTLIQARNRVDANADAEYSFVQALSQAMQPDSIPQIKSTIEQVFHRVSARKFGSHVDSLIQSIIDKAIRRSHS